MCADYETVRVLVIEDNNDSETWDLWFQKDHAARTVGGEPARKFVRYGDVCPTPQAGCQKLLEALNEGLLPDLVVLDEMLETGGPTSALAPLGVKRVLRPFRDECSRRGLGEHLPVKFVLWSQRYTPGLAYAFVQSGGAHAFGREVPSGRFIAHLWSVHDGREKWSHGSATASHLELSEEQLAVLPYLEADLATHEIAARMIAAGELDRAPAAAQDWVNEKRRQIRDKANTILEASGQQRFQGSGHSASLAQFAIEHGNIWTPLEYRE